MQMQRERDARDAHRRARASASSIAMRAWISVRLGGEISLAAPSAL
jgi:hypothetical protein